jgi:hypothetical protein
MLDGSGLRGFHLIGDSEKTFMTDAVRKHLKEKYNATFTPVAR